MTLMGNTANVYAPGESGTQGLPPSRYQNVNILGRYNLQSLGSVNIWVGAAGLIAAIWIVHNLLGSKR